jgi:hypothetical protein
LRQRGYLGRSGVKPSSAEPGEEIIHLRETVRVKLSLEAAERAVAGVERLDPDFDRHLRQAKYAEVGANPDAAVRIVRELFETDDLAGVNDRLPAEGRDQRTGCAAKCHV